MIRPTRADDVPKLLAIARMTGVFKPVEIATLEDVLADFLRRPWGDGYHAYTSEREGIVVAFSIHGPNTMTDRTWDLYWIAVDPTRHGQGIGGELLRFIEADMRAKHARLIAVETSSLPTYDGTRAFYRNHQYDQVAVVPDFYAPGDSQVVFCKRV